MDYETLYSKGWHVPVLDNLNELPAYFGWYVYGILDEKNCIELFWLNHEKELVIPYAIHNGKDIVVNTPPLK